MITGPMEIKFRNEIEKKLDHYAPGEFTNNQKIAISNAIMEAVGNFANLVKEECMEYSFY